MIIGITGTRRGMTPQQRAFIRDILKHSDIHVLHHGGCEGVDRECHGLAMARTQIHVWPSNPTQLTWAKTAPGEVTIERMLPPLVRNLQIVVHAQILYAMPDTALEQIQSGTWATVRRARTTGTPGLIVRPDGTAQSI